jgi:hypothetical protein
MEAAQLAPGAIEPDPETSHRMTFEYEASQLAATARQHLSHRASF